MKTLITSTVESPNSVDTFLMTVRYLLFTFILIYTCLVVWTELESGQTGTLVASRCVQTSLGTEVLASRTLVNILALVVGISLVAILTDTHLGEVDMHTFLVRGTRCAATVDAMLCTLGAGPACPTHAP